MTPFRVPAMDQKVYLGSTNTGSFSADLVIVRSLAIDDLKRHYVVATQITAAQLGKEDGGWLLDALSSMQGQAVAHLELQEGDQRFLTAGGKYTSI
jgi:hypothetical protein